MTTARRQLEDALREPMRARGWTPRAAGWFTRELEPGQLGVLGLGIASQHSPPGSATVTLYVHLRDDAVEREVAALRGFNDTGYRSTTATTSLGCLMPGNRWREWPVAANTVAVVAADLAKAAQQYATPYLQRLLADERLLLAAVQSSPAYSTAVGLCRAVVLLQRVGDMDAARTLLDERVARFGSRADAAADLERKLSATLDTWLRSTPT